MGHHIERGRRKMGTAIDLFLTVEQAAGKLSSPMRYALLSTTTTRYATASALGHTNTLAALVARGLLTPGLAGNYLTAYGRKVVAVLDPGGVASMDELHAEAITENETRTVATRLDALGRGPTRPLSALVAAAAERTGRDAAAVLTTALRAADGGSDNVRWDPRRTVREFQHASDRQLHMAMGATVIGHSLVMRILRRLADTEVELARANARLIRQAVERRPIGRVANDVLDGWIEGARGNHDANGHRGELRPRWEMFHADDIRSMIKDIEREVGQ